MQRVRLFPLMIGAVMLAALPGAARADAGIVARAISPTLVERNGQKLPVTDGFSLNPGDAVVTGAEGSAELRLDDDSLFALAKDSRLRIDRFQMGAPGAAVYTLERGGIRTITGKISKGQGDVYETRVGQTSIKVQGSAYSAILCQGNCGKKYKDGLYVKRERGVIYVGNPKGKVALRARQVAYVSGDASAPVYVKFSPFDDPVISASFAIDIKIDAEIHPERIEQVLPASPS